MLKCPHCGRGISWDGKKSKDSPVQSLATDLVFEAILGSRRSFQERLRAKKEVKPYTGCWEFKGPSFKGRPGRISVANMPVSVARVSAIAYGLLKKGSPERVFQSCRNKKCFNPKHLVVGLFCPRGVVSVEDNKRKMLRKLESNKVINKKTGCWEWVGGLSKSGYGRTSWGYRKIFVHRLSAFLYKGIPLRSSGLVLHSCDNRKCFNPRHLKRGDHKKNSADAVRRGRTCRGSLVNRSKLKEDDVRKIRKDLLRGRSIASLAREWKVRYPSMWHLARGNTWAWLK